GGGGSFAGTTVVSTTHHGVHVANSAGTFALPGMTIGSGTPAPVDAISLVANPDATFSFGPLDLRTRGARAFEVSGGGTTCLAGTASSLQAVGEPALDLDGVAVGNGSGGAMALALVSSSGSADQGIDLNAVPGSLVMTGGVLANAVGA